LRMLLYDAGWSLCFRPSDLGISSPVPLVSERKCAWLDGPVCFEDEISSYPGLMGCVRIGDSVCDFEKLQI